MAAQLFYLLLTAAQMNGFADGVINQQQFMDPQTPTVAQAIAFFTADRTPRDLLNLDREL
ncbi:hypothetical protein D3C75_1344040 [compost metagenome]